MILAESFNNLPNLEYLDLTGLLNFAGNTGFFTDGALNSFRKLTIEFMRLSNLHTLIFDNTNI